MSEQWKGLHYHDRHVTAAPFGRRTAAAVEDWQDRHTPSPESEGNRK